MNKIKSIYNLTNTDTELFHKEVIECIKKLQKNRQDVEIQYQTNTLPNGQIAHNVLIIGRERDIDIF